MNKVLKCWKHIWKIFNDMESIADQITDFKLDHYTKTIGKRVKDELSALAECFELPEDERRETMSYGYALLNDLEKGDGKDALYTIRRLRIYLLEILEDELRE